MALDQSAQLDVLEALKAAERDDRIRQAAETIYQALIEAELTAVIGAHPHQRTEGSRRPAERAPAPDDQHHGRGPGAEDPAAAGRVVLRVAAGTAPPEGRPADIMAYVDGALLADLWADLVLPRAVRSAWSSVIPYADNAAA